MLNKIIYSRIQLQNSKCKCKCIKYCTIIDYIINYFDILDYFSYYKILKLEQWDNHEYLKFIFYSFFLFLQLLWIWKWLFSKVGT